MQVALSVAVYVVLTFVAASMMGWLLVGVGGGILVAGSLSTFVAAIIANVLSMRIWENRHLADIGLHWEPGSGKNLLWGLLGGAGAASAVLVPALAVRAAHFRPAPENEFAWATLTFVPFLLLFGSAGEEMIVRGFGFQKLVGAIGTWATVIPVGVLFGLLHLNNPSRTLLSTINTAGFGILFGYAFLRSHDIWLPIGLHFGWNLTLPLFGVNVSGLKIGMTSYAIEWSAGPLWSGGDYGVEGSILTTVMMLLLFLFLWKSPIQKQFAPLIDTPVEAGPPVET